MNAVAQLSADALKDGVWTVSAGNAAQGVALAAREAGAPASVLVMDAAPATKLKAIERLGASIVKAPFDECWRAVEHHQSDRMRGRLVHPFDDDDFISGNGTAALEILEDLPDVDAVVAPMGGGGLLAGICAVMASLRPEANVYAAEPENAAPLRTSLDAGRASALRELEPLVGRRRRRPVRAAEHVAAAAERRRRLHRRFARRRRAGDASWRPNAAASSSKALPPAPSLRHNRLSCGPPATAGSSPSSPAATSTSADLPHSSAPVRPTGRPDAVSSCVFPGRSELMEHAPTALPARLDQLPQLARDLWWTWETGARDLPAPRLRLVAPDRAQPRDDAAAHLGGGAGTRRRRSGVPGDLRRGRGRARRRADARRLAAHLVVAAGAARNRTTSSPISARSSRCISRCPSMPAGSACWPAITARRRSDLGVPLVGVGFMYPQGYFRQRISPEGWQQEHYERIDWDDAPIAHAQTVDGQPCVVLVPLGTRSVLVQVWEVRLGRVRLLLLDTDLEQNAPWDRELSARLYGGGQDTRLQQEIVLGLGGVLALRALGLTPAVWHLNEGHAAFVILQRLRDLLANGTSWEDALARGPAHDGVHDAHAGAGGTRRVSVPPGGAAAAGCWGSMNGHGERFLALGHYDSGNGPQFNMTALAMRSAGAINAVSQLHGEVTRKMFAPLWPDLAERDRPVEPITNGVHVPTWVSAALARSVRAASQRRRGAISTRIPRSGRASSTFPTRICGRRARRCARRCSVHPRAGAPALDPRSGRRRARRGLGRDARSERADDRLRPPVHRLQAARPGVSRPDRLAAW